MAGIGSFVSTTRGEQARERWSMCDAAPAKMGVLRLIRVA